MLTITVITLSSSFSILFYGSILYSVRFIFFLSNWLLLVLFFNIEFCHFAMFNWLCSVHFRFVVVFYYFRWSNINDMDIFATTSHPHCSLVCVFFFTNSMTNQRFFPILTQFSWEISNERKKLKCEIVSNESIRETNENVTKTYIHL